MSTQHRWRRSVVFGAVAWLLLAGITVLQLWPDVPKSRAGWILFITIGPPLYVLLEATGSWLFSQKRGMAISRSRFSLLRVFIALLLSLVLLSGVWWLAWLIGNPS
jgi:hypothetical protein